MGKKLVIAGFTSSDTSAPKLATIDGILPDAGAVALIEPGHPANPLVGVPANNGVIPNLALAQAKALRPSASDVALSAYAEIGSGWAGDGVTSKAERSAKGGLYLMNSRANPATNNLRQYMIRLNTGLEDYLTANKSHSMYSAFWGRSVTPPLALSAGAPQHTGADGALFLFYSRPNANGETQYPNTAKRIGHFGEGVSPMVAGAPIFQDIAITDFSTAGSSIARPLYFIDGFGTGSEFGKLGAMIFYGFYMEDLTVSGRTYAQVDALVKAKYTKEVKTAGGRYFGDTYSAPIA